MKIFLCTCIDVCNKDALAVANTSFLVGIMVEALQNGHWYLNLCRISLIV